MPAPQTSILQNLAKMNFKGKGIKLPTDWQQPTGEQGKQYADTFKPEERSVAPDAARIFMAAGVNKYHVDTQKSVSEKFEKYIDGICSAICSAWSTWHSTAIFTGVIINAVTGVMPPCGLIGPPLMPLIMASAPKSTPQELRYSTAIASAISTAWQAWQSGVTIPGLPLYPAFAAIPAPVAPPTPNVPFPLASAPSAGESMLSPSMLKNMMVGNLGDPTALHHAELFDAIATAFNTVFMQYKATTMVTNILGTGPVPTFAPPFVPVGPVVCGMGNSIPGGLV